MQRYHWPGNIRELENLIERSVITSAEGHLQMEIPAPTGSHSNSTMSLQEVEREYIVSVLENVKWKIEGVDGAASKIGLKPSTLRFRMKKLNIHRIPSE